MIKILTAKEYRFLQELGALMEKYDAVFTFDGNRKGISLLIYEGEEALGEDERLRKAIYFEGSFDEGEIEDLLMDSSEKVKQMSKEYEAKEKNRVCAHKRFSVL